MATQLVEGGGGKALVTGPLKKEEVNDFFSRIFLLQPLRTYIQTLCSCSKLWLVEPGWLVGVEAGPPTIPPRPWFTTNSFKTIGKSKTNDAS